LEGGCPGEASVRWQSVQTQPALRPGPGALTQSKPDHFEGMQMSAQPPTPPQTPNVSLSCIELSRFRRLAQARVQIDKKTTVLVGANNSGKTSILLAVRNFLATTGQVFGAFDISLDQWPALRALGEEWAAAGFTDTLLRWKMKPEVVHGEKKDIQPRVQA
jgi:hypothetical protein